LSDTIPVPVSGDYARLGYVANPFATLDESGSEPYWMRIVTRAAANRLLAATLRARLAKKPVLVTMLEEIPEYYYRVAQNDFLRRMSDDPSLDMMALNIPLDIMRLGRIRGTIAELSELVVAVDMPLTVSAWFARELPRAHVELPESGLVTAEDVAAVVEQFIAEPHATFGCFFDAHSEPVSASEMDAVVHEAYMRQVAQPVDMEKSEEVAESVPALVEHVPNEPVAIEAPADPDADMREYLLAFAREHLSPVLARALAGYGKYGESLAAQEMKVTKAPRKTLAAILRLMNARWGAVTVIYDNFSSWPILDHQTKMDILGSLTELRWIVAETGVMVVAVLKGESPELEEQFAAAAQVDWSMPELTAMYGGDTSVDLLNVQSWLDAASMDGVSPVRADGPELASLVSAADGDVTALSMMAELAFRDAATRGVDTLDETAVAAGLEAKKSEVAG
jgi:hypothetical protein